MPCHLIETKIETVALDRQALSNCNALDRKICTNVALDRHILNVMHLIDNLCMVVALDRQNLLTGSAIDRHDILCCT